MIVTWIKESNWKSFEDLDIKPNTPYWFKKTNGDVVLATWHSTSHGDTGWALTKVEKDCFTVSNTEFHILKGALIQEAIIQ